MIRLRAAGAVVLGKANLSEWANFRGCPTSHLQRLERRGGFTLNPYVPRPRPVRLELRVGAAAAANLGAVSLGTETDGSIVCPSSHNALVGIKPTLGLTPSRAWSPSPTART